MTTLLLTHPASLDHLTPPGHPERPDRIRALNEVLAEAGTEPGVIFADIDPMLSRTVREKLPSLHHDRDFAVP